MIRYRNSNTGDVVERPEPSARLERLPNWERLDTPKAPAGGGGGPSAPEADKPPVRSASKAEWQEYARGRAKDSDENDAIDGMTKEQLIEQYGGGG
ncbi:hypothetical protein HUF15_00530 [Streptomyces samsunensis]|uniref:hypothetical protein n=1 Tax=Streptomyces malaysiensis TaxID=92644 RepID=UPI0015831436|nr:hypothetical protein [Streptomyces samsunensis]NUH35267.1 hypothetical protein [Streptomyces samsunensis]